MTQPPGDQHDDGGDKRRPIDEEAERAGWYRMAGVGVEFIVAIALFAGIGYGIDRWRGTSPWGILIGAAIGFAVGLRAMIRVAMKSFK